MARKRLGIAILLVISIPLALGIITVIQDSQVSVESEMLNYRVVDNYLGGSCNIYKMIFKEVDQRDQLDDCILRVALSGKCPRLTKEDYISDYEYFLGQPENKLAITNNNYICLEYYTTLGIRQQEINKLMQITSMQLNKKVSIKSVWEESVEFYIK